MVDTEQCVRLINNIVLDLTETIKTLNWKVCACTVAPVDIEKWNKHRLNSKKTFSLNYHSSLETFMITARRGHSSVTARSQLSHG